jgi:hypothetical protein
VREEYARGEGVAMSEALRIEYIAAFAIDLEGGVTMQRWRARRGGRHKMRLVHQESGVSVEQEYNDSQPVIAVMNDLIGRLRLTHN